MSNVQIAELITDAVTKRISHFLQERYPSLAPLIDELGTLRKLRRQETPVPEAVVRVTIGQMLSGKAARSIYDKVRSEAERRKLAGSWLLDHRTLRRCGLSARKIRTIREFAESYSCDRKRFEAWPSLVSDELFAEVRSFWGMSDWSAAMLGIFYFAHEDIFPETDGSLRRAIALLPKAGYWHHRQSRLFDADRATPFRSYLALYLWKALDQRALE